MEESPQAIQTFPVEKEYTRCVDALTLSGILTHLPKSESMGVIGIDGKEYPVPTLEQVEELFTHNREIVSRKVPQGFDRLELIPLAMPAPLLIDLLKTALLQHAAEGAVYQNRHSPTDPFVPVRINAEKQVWVWETLRLALDTDELVYFLQEYSSNQQGLTKLEVIQNGRFCAVPGWSVGLVESLAFIPGPGEGLIAGGRKQLEIGLSPREYLQSMREDAYAGESGRTLEDFLTEFLIHLATTSEVSRDIDDQNALWCLAQYMVLPYAEVVPTGRWIRSLGRLRLDTHRTGNKKCTKSVGAATMVRLPKP
jgi:hypothetical protein